MAESDIITGQYVRINQTAASIGERMIARGIDIAIISLYVVAVSISLSLFTLEYTNLFIFFVCLIYLPSVFYSFLFELFNNGQSPGKMIMKLRVVHQDGTTPTIGSYFLRWLLFGLDSISGIGILTMLLSRHSQRLGDLAAGTIVIKLHDYRKMQVSLDEFEHLSPNYQPVFPEAAELTLNQIDVIQRTLASDYGESRDQRIALLYNKVKALLQLPDTRMQPEQCLYTLVRDYQHYAMEVV